MNHFRKQILFVCDSIILIAVSAFFSWFSLRYNLSDAVGRSFQLLQNFLLLYGCTVLFQFIFRTYDSLWRYAESKEYLSLLMAAFCGVFLYEVLSRLFLQSVISFMLLTCVASMWVLGMLMMRFAYRVYRSRVLFYKGRHQIPVAIVGAGAAGVQLLEELQSNPDSRYNVQCFFDDDPEKLRKRIHGVEVKGRIDQVQDSLRTIDIREIIVAIPSADEDRRHEIFQKMSGLEGIKVSVLPSTLDMIHRKPIHTQLREIRIEDILGREPVYLDPTPVDAYITGEVIMVTGGGGSIGSELCRQIVKHDPKELVIVDIYENGAYDIQQELLYQYGGRLNLKVEIASVQDKARMRQIFDAYHPDVVFHAAAHKHVPLMENSPQEAMGASKRLCEMILQSMKGHSGTDFIAVRFGNVLGSNGSVVPLFQRQIAAGGPVTVTDKRIIRYFMTIQEAAQLVLQTGAMARKNELFVLNMGQPVKILDLAENMIRLSGYAPYRDIDIIETGLRPGEKLYEELLIASRDIEQTENSQIFIERQPAITPGELKEKLVILQNALEKDNPSCIREALHRVVPTFHEPEEVNCRQGGEVRIPTQQMTGM